MQTFIFHLSRTGQSEPDVLSVTVSGGDRARELAGEILRRSPDHMAIAAWADGLPVFQLPEPEGAGRFGTESDLPRSPNLGL
jgi:hypothetical protein